MAKNGRQRLRAAQCDDEVFLTLVESRREHPTLDDFGPHDIELMFEDGELNARFARGEHTALCARVAFVACPCDWTASVTPGRYIAELVKRLRAREWERGDVTFVERVREPEHEGDHQGVAYTLHLRSSVLHAAYEEALAIERELHAGIDRTSEKAA